MKNILLLVLSVALWMGTQAKTIEKTYFFNDFQIQQQGEYAILLAPTALNTAKTGQPLLPWFASKILLPPGEAIESVEFIGHDLVQMPGSYQLSPKQYAQPLSKGASGIFAKDKKLYKSNEAYPIKNYNKGRTDYWAGHGIAMVNYTPFVYLPQSGQVSYYRQVTIVIHTQKTSQANQALNLLTSRSEEIEQIKAFVENPEMQNEYPSSTIKTDDYEMLVVTPEQFIADFDTIIGHYLIRGIRVQVKSIEEINSEMSGQDSPEKLRNYIIQEYTNHHITYVMLGGDVEHIPYRGFYCQVQSSSVYEDNNIPSDLYYSALDGNWNTDGDNKWGEIDEDDLLPEVAVARFSFSNSSELGKMINKTISYQTTPVTGDLAHPMLAGEHLWSDPLTYGSDYLELLIGYHDDNGYETTGIPEDNTFTKLYDANSSWGASTLINEINQGKNFVHHCGHANVNTVMKLSNGDITNSNFSGANGIDHQFTNVYTHGCICGSFDANDCIAEHMLKIDNFAAAFVGNSRYGWFNEGQTEGPSAHIHREFIDALYTDSLHRIGATHMESKYATAPWVNAAGQHEEGALRWCFYDCNVLGDPAMSIWTAEPWDIIANYPASIVIGQTNFDVEILSGGNLMEGLQATLVMDGIMYGTATSNQDGQASINIDPIITSLGIAKLYISGFNCTPHEYEVQVMPAEGAYIILNDYELDDNTGNNNGMADYGETININITLDNVGTEMASAITGTLSCSHSDVTINVSEATFGDIDGSGSTTLEAAFSFSLSNSVENMSSLVFDLAINSGENNWEAHITTSALAPHLSLLSFDINDEAANNNGHLDPGETVLFSVHFINDGASVTSELSGVFTTNSDFISINNGSQNMDALSPEQEAQFTYEVVVSYDAEIDDIAHLLMNIVAGSYTAYTSYFLGIGLQVEDWEMGNFTQYDWNMGGNADWILTDENTYEGDYCAQSGDIADNQSSVMSVDFTVIDTDSISFFYKVSSEVDYDFLRFSIDENEMERWSGIISWTRAAYLVSPGDHTFTWSYTKDVLVDGGQDMGWIDYIVFPAIGIIDGSHRQQLEQMAAHLFPNPVNYKAHLQFNNTISQDITIQIIDQFGRSIQIIDSRMYSKGLQDIEIDLSTLTSGNYQLIAKGEKNSFSIGFIKL